MDFAQAAGQLPPCTMCPVADQHVTSTGVSTLFHRPSSQYKQIKNLGEESVKAWGEAEFDGPESWTIFLLQFYDAIDLDGGI